MQIISLTVCLVLLTEKVCGQLFDVHQGLQPFIGSTYQNNNNDRYNNYPSNNRRSKNNNLYDTPSESPAVEQNIGKDGVISNPRDLSYDINKNNNKYASQDDINNKNNSSNDEDEDDEFEDKFFGFNVPIIDSLIRPPERTVQRKPTQKYYNYNDDYQKSINLYERTTRAPNFYSITTQKLKTVYADNNRFNNEYTTQRPSNRRTQQHHRPSNEYTDSRPIYSDSRPEYAQDNNRYTTRNPYYNRPGIKPVYTQGPPITNRPKITKPHTQRYTERPTNNDNRYDSNYNTQTTLRPNVNNYNDRPNDYNYYQKPTTTEYNYYNRQTTERPGFGNSNNKHNNNGAFDTDQTHNRPAQTHNRPAQTHNRPAQRPSNDRPYDNKPNFGQDTIQFPVENEGDPELIDWIGPRPEVMTRVQKRRFIQLAEQKCEEYKQLTTKKVQAIPLLPSPEPIQVNVSECVPPNVPLIIGGKTVPIAQFPHMAALGWKDLQTNGYSWKCGGTLLSDLFVLTAAHCAYQERDNSVSTGPPQAVQLGSSYLDDPGALVVKVAAAMRHPNYALPKSYYDVALIKLARKVSFSEMIKPACLGEPPEPGYPVIATGWGKTENNYETSEQLRGVSLSVWDIADCYQVLGTSKKIPDGPRAGVQLCAGEKQGGKDTCQGDSGGPIQTQEGCIWRICGITSFGRLCGAPNTPGVYATVDRAFIAAAVFGN